MPIFGGKEGKVPLRNDVMINRICGQYLASIMDCLTFECENV